MNGRVSRLAVLAVIPLVSACATPESRLRNGLIEAGLSEPIAGCMAERMVDRLSLMQLRRLADLKHAGRAESLEAWLHRVRALRDPEIWTITTRAAALCATGLAG